MCLQKSCFSNEVFKTLSKLCIKTDFPIQGYGQVGFTTLNGLNVQTYNAEVQANSVKIFKALLGHYDKNVGK